MIENLASPSTRDDLTDEIVKGEREQMVTPTDRRRFELDIKICQRDIAILAIGIQELTESVQYLSDIVGNLEKSFTIMEDGLCAYIKGKKEDMSEIKARLHKLDESES